MTIKGWQVAFLSLFLAPGSLWVEARAPLTFEERVGAQEAIERVYYEHRIWPEENLRPKPAFEEAVPRAVLEAKVSDYLKKCVALDLDWKQPILPGQLQGEMERMARATRDPAVLQELFAALGSDPTLVAECLARPILAERLLMSAYLGTAGCGDLWGHFSPTAGDAVVEYQSWWEAEAQRLAPGDPKSDLSYDFTLPSSGGDRSCQSDTWTRIGKVPDTRTRFTAVWTGTEMIVWGGATTCAVFNSGGRYNPATDTWAPTSQGGLAPSARRSHTAVWTGTEMIIWGGIDWGGNYLKGGGRYNPLTDQWSGVSATGFSPTARANHTAVWTGTAMIVWGGTTAYQTQTNTGGRYDPAANSWQATSTAAPAPSSRTNHSAVWTGSEMNIWGGMVYTGGLRVALSTGARYDPVTDIWVATSAQPACPEPRYDHSAVWTGSRMVIWGGAQPAGDGDLGLTSGGRYDPTADTWEATSQSGACPTQGASLIPTVWTGTEMLVWLPAGGRYNPAQDTWAPMSAGGQPSYRSYAKAVWSGTEMLVWGGSDDNSLATGGRYKPATDSWAPIATDAALPIARTSHGALWTGSEMLLWGGYKSFAPQDYFNSGYLYYPATDSWTPMAGGAGCPAARAQFACVWNGQAAIIWGGGDSTGGFTDGGIYDPIQGAWTAIPPPSGSPAKGGASLSAWTGSRLLVWEGSSRTGGQYDPDTQIWTAVSSSGSPASRSYATSVWTGTELIVWGGEGGNIYNSGGRYNPALDSWQATSTGQGCPTGRIWHGAVWTGDRMVVWGGQDSSYNPIQSGGRYDPATDSWTSTSLGSGCPIQRTFPITLWTGREMIIWGGFYSSARWYEDGGARYNPSSNTWQSISGGDGKPGGRARSSAVWTGNQMILWGGDASCDTDMIPGYTYGSGGIYCAPASPLAASASATPTSGQAPLQVAFACAASGGVPPYSYLWNFGDGTNQGTASNPSHTYSSEGTYHPAVTVRDSTGGLASDSHLVITVTAPPACALACTASAQPASGPAPLQVTFTATSTPSNCSGAASYAWAFGDGQGSTQKSVTHTYASAGTYAWTMTAAIQGVTCSKNGSVVVEEPCSLSCSATAPETGKVGEATLFEGSAAAAHCTGTPSFAWAFGDGETSSLQSPLHTYGSAGTFSWLLTVLADGVPCTRSGYITILEPCIIACSAIAPPIGSPGISLVFQASASASHCIETPAFAWAFGDGASSHEQNPSHAYASPGTYTWTLTTSADDKTCTRTGEVAVSEPCSVACAADAEPASGIVPLSVTFTGSAMTQNCGGAVAYAWAFGDGALSAEQNSSHTYASAGSYAWTLTVTVDGKTCLQTGTITVAAPCAVACEASATPGSGTAPLLVAFAGSVAPSNCAGEPSYAWAFGDGGASAEQSPSHTYTAANTYTWTLTVTVGGVTCGKTGIVTVEPGLPGDANNDGVVSIGEVQQAINMFLGIIPPGNGADCDSNGAITIGEVQKVINAFLGLATGCL